MCYVALLSGKVRELVNCNADEKSQTRHNLTKITSIRICTRKVEVRLNAFVCYDVVRVKLLCDTEEITKSDL